MTGDYTQGTLKIFQVFPHQHSNPTAYVLLTSQEDSHFDFLLLTWRNQAWSILSVLMQIQLRHSKWFLVVSSFSRLWGRSERKLKIWRSQLPFGAFLPRCVAALDTDVVSVLVRSTYFCSLKMECFSWLSHASVVNLGKPNLQDCLSACPSTTWRAFLWTARLTAKNGKRSSISRPTQAPYNLAASRSR